MPEVHSVCLICGASLPAHTPQRGLCPRPCRPQARLQRRLVEVVLRACEPKSLLATCALTTGFLLVSAALDAPSALHQLLAGLLCSLALAHALAAWVTWRELQRAARDKRDLLRRGEFRYLRRLAPPRTRCSFCRCDFFSNEVASSCRACKTLVHAECVGELLDGPGPSCPTYGCSGARRR